MRAFWMFAVLFSICGAEGLADPIALWNFNDAITGVTGGAQEFSVDSGIGLMSSSFDSKYIGNLGGTDINAFGGDAAGRALKLQAGAGLANNGKNLSWHLSTAGFDNIHVSLAMRRTSTGFSQNSFQYSADAGTNWQIFGAPFTGDSAYARKEWDFSNIPAMSNNPMATFRIVFDGAAGASGNIRLDNLFISGNRIPESDPIPEPSTLALLGLGLVGFALGGRLQWRC